MKICFFQFLFDREVKTNCSKIFREDTKETFILNNTLTKSLFQLLNVRLYLQKICFICRVLKMEDKLRYYPSKSKYTIKLPNEE